MRIQTKTKKAAICEMKAWKIQMKADSNFKVINQQYKKIMLIENVKKMLLIELFID